MLTEPLELSSRLRPLPRNGDALFYVTVGALVLFFLLFGSRFVLAPGITFSLPQNAAAVASAAPTDLVVNLQRDTLVLFEGGRYSLEGFRQKLDEVVKARGPVRLLLLADRQTSSQGLGALISTAMAAGCGVQLAADLPGGAADDAR